MAATRSSNRLRQRSESNTSNSPPRSLDSERRGRGNPSKVTKSTSKKSASQNSAPKPKLPSKPNTSKANPSTKSKPSAAASKVAAQLQANSSTRPPTSSTNPRTRKARSESVTSQSDGPGVTTRARTRSTSSAEPTLSIPASASKPQSRRRAPSKASQEAEESQDAVESTESLSKSSRPSTASSSVPNNAPERVAPVTRNRSESAKPQEDGSKLRKNSGSSRSTSESLRPRTRSHGSADAEPLVELPAFSTRSRNKKAQTQKQKNKDEVSKPSKPQYQPSQDVENRFEPSQQSDLGEYEEDRAMWQGSSPLAGNQEMSEHLMVSNQLLQETVEPHASPQKPANDLNDMQATELSPIKEEPEDDAMDLTAASTNHDAVMIDLDPQPNLNDYTSSLLQLKSLQQRHGLHAWNTIAIDGWDESLSIQSTSGDHVDKRRFKAVILGGPRSSEDEDVVVEIVRRMSDDDIRYMAAKQAEDGKGAAPRIQNVIDHQLELNISPPQLVNDVLPSVELQQDLAGDAVNAQNMNVDHDHGTISDEQGDLVQNYERSEAPSAAEALADGDAEITEADIPATPYETRTPRTNRSVRFADQLVRGAYDAPKYPKSPLEHPETPSRPGILSSAWTSFNSLGRRILSPISRLSPSGTKTNKPHPAPQALSPSHFKFRSPLQSDPPSKRKLEEMENLPSTAGQQTNAGHQARRPSSESDNDTQFHSRVLPGTFDRPGKDAKRRRTIHFEKENTPIEDTSVQTPGKLDVPQPYQVPQSEPPKKFPVRRNVRQRYQRLQQNQARLERERRERQEKEEEEHRLHDEKQKELCERGEMLNTIAEGAKYRKWRNAKNKYLSNIGWEFRWWVTEPEPDATEQQLHDIDPTIAESVHHIKQRVEWREAIFHDHYPNDGTQPLMRRKTNPELRFEVKHGWAPRINEFGQIYNEVNIPIDEAQDVCWNWRKHEFAPGCARHREGEEYLRQMASLKTRSGNIEEFLDYFDDLRKRQPHRFPAPSAYDDMIKNPSLRHEFRPRQTNIFDQARDNARLTQVWTAPKVPKTERGQFCVDDIDSSSSSEEGSVVADPPSPELSPPKRPRPTRNPFEHLWTEPKPPTQQRGQFSVDNAESSSDDESRPSSPRSPAKGSPVKTNIFEAVKNAQPPENASPRRVSESSDELFPAPQTPRESPPPPSDKKTTPRLPNGKIDIRAIPGRTQIVGEDGLRLDVDYDASFHEIASKLDNITPKEQVQPGELGDMVGMATPSEQLPPVELVGNTFVWVQEEWPGGWYGISETDGTEFVRNGKVVEERRAKDGELLQMWNVRCFVSDGHVVYRKPGAPKKYMEEDSYSP